jgi:hypothetical protein
MYVHLQIWKLDFRSSWSFWHWRPSDSGSTGSHRSRPTTTQSGTWTKTPTRCPFYESPFRPKSFRTNVFIYNLVQFSSKRQEQKTGSPDFQTKNSNLGKFWRVLHLKTLVYYVRPFGIFYGNVSSFGIFSPLYQEKSGNHAKSSKLWTWF